jgi:cold shock CspA family protein
MSSFFSTFGQRHWFTGICVHWCKDYGFIRVNITPNTHEDIFFHKQDITDSVNNCLQQGSEFSFTTRLNQAKGKYQAKNVSTCHPGVVSINGRFGGGGNHPSTNQQVSMTIATRVLFVKIYILCRQ